MLVYEKMTFSLRSDFSFAPLGTRVQVNKEGKPWEEALFINCSFTRFIPCFIYCTE